MKKDGVTRYTTEVVGDNMTMLGGGGGNSSQAQQGGDYSAPQQSQASAPVQDAPGDATDDLPF